MFKITIDTNKKRLEIFAEGFFTDETMDNFIKEYKAKISSINPKDYTLTIDTRGMKVSSPSVAAKMNDVINLHLNTPFANRYAYKFEELIAQMQIDRLGRQFANWNLIKFISSTSEII